jgi:hypothetical protein
MPGDREVKKSHWSLNQLYSGSGYFKNGVPFQQLLLFSRYWELLEKMGTEQLCARYHSLLGSIPLVI